MKKIENLHYKLQRVGAITKRYFINTFSTAKGDYSEITQYSGSSLLFGKKEAINFIEKMCPDKNSRILDVGPGRGIYYKMLKEKGYRNLEAVEIYLPYIKHFELHKMYHRVFHSDILDFEYEYYDIVIMGDVIEHLKIRNAQKVLRYAQKHSSLTIVAVPYQSRQIGSQLDGSGDHRQPDLTREVFLTRYPGFELLLDNHQLGVFFSKRTDL